MMNKEAIQQQAAEYYYSDDWGSCRRNNCEMHETVPFDTILYAFEACAEWMQAQGCAPVGEAPQPVRDLVQKPDKEGNYGTEASNTDEAVGATLHSSAGNSVEQGENGDPWISVKDRLPYKDGDSQIFCLVWDTYEGQAVVRPYNEYHKCWDGEDADDFYTDATEGNITHWMPLPQPPKSK